MYDSTNEAHEFVADARGEAIEKACKFFGVQEDELEVRGFETGEVYGLGGREVVVVALKGRRRPAERRDEGRRDEGRNDRDPARRGEGRGRDRGRDRGRGEGRREGGGRDRSRSSRGRRDEAAPSRVEVEAPSEPSVGTVNGEIGELGSFVRGLVERMDLGSFEISESEDGDLLVIEVRGPAATALSASEGRPGDAIQLLANQAAVRVAPERQRVVVEVEGDADAREELLSSLARRVAKRALDSGRSVALDPMNGKDRRTIHMAIREIDDVASMSIGEGSYRQVVVVPEGAPEYEEASRESRGASSRSER